MGLYGWTNNNSSPNPTTYLHWNHPNYTNAPTRYSQECLVIHEALHSYYPGISGGGTVHSYDFTKLVVEASVALNIDVSINEIKDLADAAASENRTEEMNGFLDDLGVEQCFPAGTPIRLWDGSTVPIEEITPSDIVMSFNAAGDLVPGRVTQLLHNVTAEWLKLSTGTVVTPGHRFLRPDGSFAEIADILAGDGRIVAEDGAVMTVTAERIVYSADTAHLFEEAEKMAYGTDGGAALAPKTVKGWRTYNFTVAEHHTYIADGIRVHNDSVLATLENGDKLIALNADLTNAAVLRDVNGDGTLDFVTLDGYQRGGQPTEIALERVYYWNAVSGDLETLIANELANAPNAAGHVFDPGAGNNWNDGTFGDDIEEVFFDDVVGASGSGTNRAVIDGLYSATFFGGVDVSSLASAGDIVASQNLIDAINAASASSTDALGIAAWLLGIEVGSLAYLAMVALLEDDLTGPPPDGIVQGTSGNDLIDSSFTDSDGDTPGNGNDTIEGLGGSDTIFGGAGQDVIYGHNGADMLHGGSQADTIRGGNGNDTVWGDNGRDTVYLGNGNDVFNDNNQSDGNGADTVYGQNGDDTINGAGGNDVFWGGTGNDTIYGGIGDDEIHGGADDDTITAGDGNDIVWGDQGRDTIDLGAGDDVFHDDPGPSGLGSFFERDTVHGGTGDDTINGGEGNDTFYGNAGNDTISGGTNDDMIYGGNNDDVLDGEGGQDSLFGGNGNDQVVGGGGRDEVRGGAGDDILDGGTGLDMLYGGGGNDTLQGGSGGDTLTGGGGADTFVFTGNFHLDVITDFDPNRAGERIDLSGVAEITDYADLTANHLSQQGTSMVIAVNPSNTITLEDVSSLSANDFIF